MVAISEKHICSARYLWQLFVYTVNMFLLLFTVALLRCSYLLRPIERQDYLIKLLTEDYTLSMGSPKYAYQAGACFLLLAVFIFLPLMRYVGYDLENRAGTRRLLFSLGYRRLAAVRYETAYFVFDFALAWLAGATLLEICWLMLRNTAVAQAFLAAMETNLFLSPGVFLLTGAATGAAVFLQVFLRIEH
ncbi:MAG: hypothetical protein LUE29_10050 [Lachnospiraceae bacterium]|nr:hypothetical protein [Lachnospiraceae bacterium]